MNKCKLCEQGVKLVGKEHWIVKSVVPAKITIKKCTAVEKEENIGGGAP